MLRVAGNEELQSHFHDFFAGEFTTGEVVEDDFSMVLEDLFPFRDAANIGFVEFEPPVCFKLCKS